MKIVSGNLFKANATILVNAVNTVGVMGAGIALQFKHKYPEMFIEYAQKCKNKELKGGDIWVWKVPNSETWILNIATKEFWGNPSNLIWVKKGLMNLSKWLTKNAKTTDIVAIPALGCGKGELLWETVSPLMQKALENIPCEILIFQPLIASPVSKSGWMGQNR